MLDQRAVTTRGKFIQRELPETSFQADVLLYVSLIDVSKRGIPTLVISRRIPDRLLFSLCHASVRVAAVELHLWGNLQRPIFASQGRAGENENLLKK